MNESDSRVKSNRTGGVFRNIAFALGFIIPVLLRLLPINQFITPDRIYFYGTDPYDHMRRASLILNDFPKIPDYSYYQVYPKGTVLQLTPLFDFMIAAAAYVLGVGSPSERTVMLAGLFIAPALAVLSLFAFYALAREFVSKKAALLGVFLFGIIPAYFNYSFIGQPDNNAIEPLLAMVYFFFAIRAARTGRAAYALTAGAVGVISILMWRVSTIFWLIALAAMAIYYIAERKEHILRAGFLIFFAQGLALLLMAFFGILTVRGSISFAEVSYFHAILCLSLGLGFLSAEKGTPIMKRFKLPEIFSGILLFLVPPVAIMVLSPEFVSELLSPLKFLGKTDVLYRVQNIEYSSIIFKDGSFSFMKPSSQLTFLFWLLPLGLIWCLTNLLKPRGDKAGMSFLFVSTAVFLAVTLSHMRFAHLLAVCVALLVCLVVEKLILPVRDIKKKLVLGLAVLLMASPAFSTIYGFSVGRIKLIDIEKEHFEAMDWIRANTPETSYFMEPWKKPEYGVMAEWSLGSWIENVAERPAVATNYTPDPSGVTESLKFMLSESEEEAAAILERNNVRYVVITNLIADLEGYAEALGLPGGYAKLVRGSWTPGKRYFDLVSTSLLLADGAPDGKIPLKRLSRFRLIFESTAELKSTGLSRPVKKIKVFEYVKGAQ